MNIAIGALIAVIAAFLVGGIPWGLLLVRVFAKQDIRTIGSGKTGATNVLRVLGWQGFAAAIVLDLLKGIAAVFIARGLTGNPWVEAVAGVAAIAGHTWSPYLGFKGGGRGMVTAIGVGFTMAPLLLLLIPVFLIPVLITRYMSLGNLIAASVAPFVMLYAAAQGWTEWAYFFYVAAGGAFVIFNHADNIQRIRAGTERKIGEKSPTTAVQPIP